MSSTAHIPQDGTSRQQRMPDALRPDYIVPDERSREDLLRFARELAAEITYYNKDNQPEGNWETFFADDIPESAPHKALFLTFLELFSYAKQHLNTLTQRHLDFYYNEVLRLREKPATPDQVHLLFQLAKNVKSHLIAAGTLLKAGKDNNGKPLYYATERDIVINKATIANLKTLFIAKDSNSTQKLCTAPVANSADGLGAPFQDTTPHWEIFGHPEKGQQADIGFAIASPLLFLNEGERTIEIILSFTETPDITFTPDTFSIYLSGTEGWITATLTEYSGTPLTQNQLGLTLSLDTTQPAVTAYDATVLEGHFHTPWPMLKLLLNDHSNYDALQHLQLEIATLTVTVTGVKNLLLQNDQGRLDPARPFLPFGTQPTLGSTFYIGSPEAFRKKLDSLNLHLQWHDVPQDNLGSYYFLYEDGITDEVTSTLTSSIFQADLSLLHRQQWEALATAESLFEADARDLKTLTTAIGFPDYERNTHPQPPKPYDHNTQNGFIKLELTGPATPFKAFGHTAYPKLYTKQAIALTQEEDVQLSDIQMPNDPYTPTIKSLVLDYTSTQEINFQEDGNGTEQFFHLNPFGHSEWTPDIPDSLPSLLPRHTDEGTLYIGIRELTPPQQLSLLFRPAEGSTDPDNSIRQEDIQWSYLSGTQWIPFKAQQLLSDTTNAFQATGTITLNIPQEASVQHNLMPEGLHWIKAAVETGAAGAGKLTAIHTQAVTANFSDRDNDPTRLSRALPPQQISGLAKRQSAIKQVLQPYPSFNGKAAEQYEAFYTRISERLCHKARAVSRWDYERLVLEKFPSIYKVKCLNHTRIATEQATSQALTEAGCVTLITLPGATHKNTTAPLAPKTGSQTLRAIEAYIRQYTSPFVKVEVRNPRYEQLQLCFKVRFTEGADQGYHQQLLEEEIIRFLAPWAYEATEDITFGNTVYKSAVLDFVEKRPYVDFVTDFVLYHSFEADPPTHNVVQQGNSNVYTISYHFPAPDSVPPPQEPPEPLMVLDFVLGVLPNTNPDSLLDDLNTYLEEEQQAGRLATLQRTALRAWIESQTETVDLVENLRLFHIEGTLLKEDTERAVAVRPGAIITAAPTQDIRLVDTEGHQCPGIESIGIGSMVMHGDFLVS